MITRIEISGFKSFHKFSMDFTPLTIIAGINASGKSNLFDALKLISDLAESNLRTAFKNQRGEMQELFYLRGDEAMASEMSFAVEMLVDRKIKDAWGNSEELKYTRLRYELKIRRFINDFGLDDLEVIHERLVNLKHEYDTWISAYISKGMREIWRPSVKTGKRSVPYIDTDIMDGTGTIIALQDGTTGNKRKFPSKHAFKTVLSTFDSVDFPHILAAKEEMLKWKFLELSPAALRLPTNKKNGEDRISSSGENLAGALHRIAQSDPESLRLISRKLNEFLPNFIEVTVQDDKENNQFIIKLISEDKTVYSSRVLSEGTLRILALCILEYDDQFSGLLCFEEPENGLHPFRIRLMYKLLKNLCVDLEDDDSQLRQVIVNTHSPELLAQAITADLDLQVSIHFSKMVTLVTDYAIPDVSEPARIKMNITKIEKVDTNSQLRLDLEQVNSRISVKNLIEILRNSDRETAIEFLEGK